eukprot:COSAG01_NODE_11228_length_1978_cov_1.907398_1_plen_315_part_00
MPAAAHGQELEQPLAPRSQGAPRPGSSQERPSPRSTDAPRSTDGAGWGVDPNRHRTAREARRRAPPPGLSSGHSLPQPLPGAAQQPTSIFRDKNRRHTGKSQSKSPAPRSDGSAPDDGGSRHNQSAEPPRHPQERSVPTITRPAPTLTLSPQSRPPHHPPPPPPPPSPAPPAEQLLLITQVACLRARELGHLTPRQLQTSHLRVRMIVNDQNNSGSAEIYLRVAMPELMRLTRTGTVQCATERRISFRRSHHRSLVFVQLPPVGPNQLNIERDRQTEVARWAWAWARSTRREDRDFASLGQPILARFLRRVTGR